MDIDVMGGEEPRIAKRRIVAQLAKVLCTSHSLTSGDLAKSGLSTSQPLPAEMLCDILRQASFIAEQRRYPPRRFVIKGINLAAGTLRGLHIPQGLEIAECMIGEESVNPQPEAEEQTSLTFTDVSLALLHVENCLFGNTTALRLEDAVIQSGFSTTNLDCPAGLSLHDVRIGHDVMILRDRATSLSAASSIWSTSLCMQLVHVAGHLRIEQNRVDRIDLRECTIGGRLRVEGEVADGRITWYRVEIGGDLELCPHTPHGQSTAIALDDIDCRGAVLIGSDPAGDEHLPLLFLERLVFEKTPEQRPLLNRIRTGQGLTLRGLFHLGLGDAIIVKDVRCGETMLLDDLYAAAGIACNAIHVAGDLDLQLNRRVLEKPRSTDDALELDLTRRPYLMPVGFSLMPGSVIRGDFNAKLLDGTRLGDATAQGSFWTWGNDEGLLAHGEDLVAGRAVKLDLANTRLGAVTISGGRAGSRNEGGFHPLSVRLDQARVAGHVRLNDQVGNLAGIYLREAEVTGAIDIADTRWSKATEALAPGQESAVRANIDAAGLDAGALTIGQIKAAPSSLVADLTNARIGLLDDGALLDVRQVFSAIRVTGLKFDALATGTDVARDRAGWLNDHARISVPARAHATDAPLWLRYTNGFEALARGTGAGSGHRERTKGNAPIGVPDRAHAIDVSLWLRYARALEAQGQQEQADRLRIELRKAQRHVMAFGMQRGIDALLDWTAAYGFNHMHILRAFCVAWVFFALFWALVWHVQGQAGERIDVRAAMLPTLASNYTQVTESPPAAKGEGSVSSDGGQTGILPRTYPPFQPAVYALGLLVPVIDIGMASHWSPNLRWDPHGGGAEKPDHRAEASWSGLFLQAIKVLNMGTGFALLALWVTALTGLLRRGDGEP